MILTHYLIHFINGEVLHVSECKKDDDEMDLADEYIASIPSGILQVGKEGMLNQLFEPHQIRHEVGNFKYDAKAEDMHYLSFLDSDIVKLRSVRNHIRKNPVNLTVICFKEQVAFLKSYLGESVKMRTYEIGEIMDTLECERRTGL